MAVQQGQSSQSPSYVIYDKVTGRPVGRYRQYDLATDSYCACDADEVLSLFTGSDTVLKNTTDAAPDNLAVLQSNMPEGVSLRTLHVAQRSHRLVERPRLHLAADRDELEGDGKDSAQLTLALYDSRGHIDGKGTGRVRVTTTRGKLSARGGMVELAKGRASLTLTSVPETVHQVVVRAERVDGDAQAAEITLAFV